MSGLKSGAGDDLWDDEEESEERDADHPSGDEKQQQADQGDRDGSDESAATSDGGTTTSPSEGESSSGSQETRPYIVRRAIQDKSVQFERDERLTFFVHRDVAEGERSLVADVESALGRDVPKFDVREAVYRAALRNREDVLAELLEMGYSLDEE